MKKKETFLDAESELFESEKNLENLELIRELYVIYTKGIINDAEFKVAKHYIITFGGFYSFKKARYQRYFLGAITILHELLKSSFITESQYHEAIPLVVKTDRDVNFVRYLRAGLINFDEFLSPEKSKLIKWLGLVDTYTLGVPNVNFLALELYEEHGYSVERYYISKFRKRLRIIMKKGDSDIEIRQSPRFFGGYKIYIVDEKKKKISYDKFIKRFA